MEGMGWVWDTWWVELMVSGIKMTMNIFTLMLFPFSEILEMWNQVNFFFFWSAARLSYFPRLTSQSSFLALSPNTIPIISQRSTDPAVSDHLIFQEKLEIELLHDTFLFLNVNNSIFLLLLTNKTYCGLDLVANLQPVSRILCSAF